MNIEEGNRKLAMFLGGKFEKDSLLNIEYCTIPERIKKTFGFS